MKVVVQRTKRAKVTVKDNVVGAISRGLMLLVGVTHLDNEADAKYLAEKIANLRIFEDENEKMNYSLLDINGQVLSISQFTLYGDCRKGRRPNFIAAAKPNHALGIYNIFNEELRARGIVVATGEFGSMMEIDFINDGPVTLILDSEKS